MSALVRPVVARKIFQICPSRVINPSPVSLRHSLLLARCASGRSVLTEIDKKRKEAELGGGQKRIDTQHRKVSRPFLVYI